MRKYSGLNMMELLIALVILSILMFPIIDILSSAFNLEYINKLNLEAKQQKKIALDRITTNINSAAYYYSSNVTIPGETGNVTVTPTVNGISILIPAFDDEGNLIISATDTEFEAYTYAIVPNTTGGTTYTLLESYDTITCQTSPNDPTQPVVECDSDLSGGTTNVLIKNMKPGIFGGYFTPFAIDLAHRNNVIITFGSKDGTVYFPSSSGPAIDSKYIDSIDVLSRNITFL